jgi:hypothetical protein
MWWRRLRYVLLLAGLCSIATCPAAKRACTAKSRAREADELTEYLADRVAAAIAANGRVPSAMAGPTPLPACCDRDDGICEADPAIWATPAWQALAFSIDGDHRFTYSYIPAEDGRSAVVRATGDTDCDGEASLFEVEIRIDSTGVQRTATTKNPYE